LILWKQWGKNLGLIELYIGAVTVGIMGNAAEHSSAIAFTLKGNMNLALNIGIGSGIQLALFVVLLLVIIGIISDHRFTLDFTLF
jgi:Ca2+:H+ antiporter